MSSKKRQRHNKPSSRCCAVCYHYGDFVGLGQVCEITCRPRKDPYGYRNCEHFAYVDMITWRKVSDD